MKNYVRFIFLILLIVSIAFSCKDTGQYQSIPVQKNNEKDNKTHKVIAKAFENAGMYTYVNVSENENEFWIALPEQEIKIGETYYYKGGMKMVDFKSKELDKEFKEVWFIEALYNKEPRAFSSAIAKKNAIINAIDVIEQPKNGTSVEKLLKDSDSFLNKDVVIKGKVVKVNRNILDRNWVHLIDGTTFDSKTEITITTLDSITVGDIVTFSGQVTLNKDFGYGYVYPILIENGKLVK